MKKLTMTLALLALAAGTALAQAPAAQGPKTASKSATVSVTATVEKIDHTTRTVTLKGPEQEVTFVAGDEVKNLDKIKKGDSVTAVYHVGLLAEARAATPEEKANPKQGVVAGGKAMEGGKPAAGIGAKIKVVATVVAIDKAKRTATFKGPEGKTATIEAENPANLDKIKVGDTVVFTYTEALAISVAPEAGK
jgi:Cu/Ag efflux protein CusF